MLSKILKVMAIVILLPLFVMCGAPMFMAGGAVVEGMKQGYEQAEAEAEANKETI